MTPLPECVTIEPLSHPPEAVVRVRESEGLDTVMRRAVAGDATLVDMAERAKALVERRDAEARGVIGRVLALLP